MDNKKITVTRPVLPPLEEFTRSLEKIWDNKILTNNGPFHQEFEKKLAEYLGVQYLSLFTNGTLALVTALQALGVRGEVITSPFSFVATTHAIWWNKLKPVFADIEPGYFNLDPARIEAAITPNTSAILPIHVYGNPCRVEEISSIAEKHKLKVIYDAAHAFGVKINGNSVLNHGDLSVLSFHATKVFNTMEGGAIICHSEEMKHHIDNLKNFGFRGETNVEEPGINAKMNEFQAALGLLQLKYIDEVIDRRRAIAETYRRELAHVKGIGFLNDMPGVKHSYTYFPILIDQEAFGMSRDQLYEKLKEHHIYGRRYFYPLISNFYPYRDLKSAVNANLPIANQISERVLCLPFYPDLDENHIELICSIIERKKK